jgi:hypothetical protein
MRYRRHALCAAILVAALATASCVPAGRPSGASGAAAPTPGEPPRPAIVGFADGAAPAFSRTDQTLPAGCTVEDFTDTLAAYTQLPDPAHATDAIGLLDLATGRHTIVLVDGVNAAAHYDVFAPRLSDSVMAWEEVTPGEGDDMGHAGWRLYAAPIDRRALTMGTPALVAKGRTESLQRPFYAVDGGTVYWTSVASGAARRAGGAAPDAVLARDLAGGAVRTVHRSPAIIDGFKLSGGVAVLTEARSTPADGAAVALTAVAVRVADGRLLRSASLHNAFELSHFADFADGWFVWTESPAPASEPSAYAMDPTGAVLLVSGRSTNPMASEGYAFVESAEATGSTTARREVHVLRGLDLRSRTRFELARTLVDTDGAWHTTVAGSRPRTLVVYDDVWVTADVPGTGVTPVRVYRW